MPGGDMKRSPTFLVNGQKQRGILEEFQKREEHYTEEFTKNKPLCFSARAYQMTHPAKARANHRDADATRTSPMLLGVCDGVSQLEDYGMDASELPKELLAVLEELAMLQLMPDGPETPADAYRGPVALLKEAYEATESLGSTTVILAVLDNSTRIHGKLHPMIAVLSIGDCELLLLRRTEGKRGDLSIVFHTEMQRIDGHCQTPLQLARVDERIDADFDEGIALEVIERGSAVHCVSAYEGDILVLGSDGVFDNLFLEEVIDIVNGCLRLPKNRGSQPPDALEKAAKQIVSAAHRKSEEDSFGVLPETPIGRGGKVDDTSVVVGEVVEWTQAHRDILAQVRRHQRWRAMTGCGGMQCAPSGGGQCGSKCGGGDDSDEESQIPVKTRGLSEDADLEESTDEEEDTRCAIT